MKKKLFLIRHGQTLFNKKNLIQGWCDSPLTPLGHRQAQAARAWLDARNFHPDHAYCSTLHRTEETIRHLCDLDYVRTDGLREFHYGDLEGEKSDSLKSAPVSDAQYDPATYYRQFDGETRYEVIDRMRETLQNAMKDPEAKEVLAVSHGSSSWLFAQSVDAKKAEALRKFANCVIYEFDYEDGQFELVDIVDEHVQDLKDPNDVLTNKKVKLDLPDM